MNDRVRIAVIGLNTLETIGIRSLLHDENDVMVERYRNFKDFYPVSDNIDGYVVESGEFVSNIDYFLPRKLKTIIVCHMDSTSCQTGLNVVYSFSDETYIKQAIRTLFQKILEKEPQPDTLSSRETEVLRLIASGKLNKEIADELFISVNTVITHRKNISSKLGIKSASGLSLYAMMNGII